MADQRGALLGVAAVMSLKESLPALPTGFRCEACEAPCHNGRIGVALGADAAVGFGTRVLGAGRRGGNAGSQDRS